MTRDFNKPKRDTSRPPFRDQSPNQSRDERSPRPARPRLNREMVDRAWESGAQQQHADYRPRTSGGQHRPQGQQQRNNGWRGDTSNGQRPAQDGRGNSRPYANRQDNYRDPRDRRDTQGAPRNFNRPYNANEPRSPYGQDRRNTGEQYSPERRDSYRNADGRDNEYRKNFQPRGQRNDRPGNFRDRPQREESNPRWQSRPGEQRNTTRATDSNFNRRPYTRGEQFEGDYEHFEERNSPHRDTRPARPAERPFRGSHAAPERSSKPFEGNRYSPSPERTSRRFADRDNDVQPERHVTRLPDGRVLKGPRPVQRRNAQFWTDVSKGTEQLLEKVADEKDDTEIRQEAPVNVVGEDLATQKAVEVINEPGEDVAVQAETPSVDETSTTQQKRRTRSASAAARGKKTTTSPSTLKPSKRGFKWPTQD